MSKKTLGTPGWWYAWAILTRYLSAPCMALYRFTKKIFAALED